MATADTDTIEKTETEYTAYVPKLYKVILHNDNKTTFDFVIAVLTFIFHRNIDDAQEITMNVHTHGKGIAGVYTKEIADEKTEEALTLAIGAGFPLQVTTEEE